MSALPMDVEVQVPRAMVKALRTDHAGETGAVWIYRGILAVSQDKEVRAFALEHLQTEQKHLTWIEQILSRRDRSKMLPVWRLAGWITGALPAMISSQAVFWTITAVETFVDQHYQDQIEWLETQKCAPKLQALLRQCQADERDHRDDANTRVSQASPGAIARCWIFAITKGSSIAVGVARMI